MDGYKQYVRTDVNGIVVKGFTDAFETPIAGDLLLTGQDGRHFTMKLSDDNGIYIYKVVNGQMIQRDVTEIQASPAYKQKRREDVIVKWESQIADQREMLRKMVDEAKPQTAIDKTRINLKNMISSKNTELSGVL